MKFRGLGYRYRGMEIEATSDVDRFIGSIEFRHQPWDWLQHRLVTGFDTNEELNSVLTPRQPEGSAHFWGAAALGSKSLDRIKRRNVTFDYGASATRDLTDRVRAEEVAPLAAGDGSVRFRGVLEAAGIRVVPDESRSHVVRALHVCRLAAGVPGVAPQAVLPDYLRAPDAKPQ
jgi:hypothetical protein